MVGGPHHVTASVKEMDHDEVVLFQWHELRRGDKLDRESNRRTKWNGVSVEMRGNCGNRNRWIPATATAGCTAERYCHKQGEFNPLETRVTAGHKHSNSHT